MLPPAVAGTLCRFTACSKGGEWLASSSATVGGPTDTLIGPFAPCHAQFGTSAAWRSAEAVQEEAGSALPEPETTGWGSTRVGELLKAKVSLAAQRAAARARAKWLAPGPGALCRCTRHNPNRLYAAGAGRGQRGVAVVLCRRLGHRRDSQGEGLGAGWPFSGVSAAHGIIHNCVEAGVGQSKGWAAAGGGGRRSFGQATPPLLIYIYRLSCTSCFKDSE